jgi:feruloyl esterase
VYTFSIEKQVHVMVKLSQSYPDRTRTADRARGIARAAGVVTTCIVLASAQASAATVCEDLAKLSLRNVTITTARTVAAGAFTPPAPAGPAAQPAAGRGRGPSFTDLQSFCQVQATLRPTTDSDIRIEVWLPAASNWNRKLRPTGNGGLGGGSGVNAAPLAAGVRLGYVTVGNNTGHDTDSSYAIDHPEKVKDFGWRSAHEQTVTAKALIKAFYDRPLLRTVMAEGGGGTIAALSSAQRFPDDVDAVAVTGMSANLSRHTAAQLWLWMSNHKNGQAILSPDQFALLHAGALDACDAGDGLKDGLIGDPERCRFDPGTLQCKAAAGASCLTADQVEAARKIYSGPANPRTKEEIYSPLYPGSELAWGQQASLPEPFTIPIEWFKYYVFKDPKWDYRTRPLNFDSDIAASDKIVDANAIDPDLRRFFGRGGKLLLVDGWNDAAVPPKVAVNYYRKVVATTGAKAVQDSMRFFMVPGMGHGPGTDGPDNFTFDALAILEQWNESGKAPDQLIVTHWKNGTEAGKRLVCQYPKIATYKGSGNTEDPASFTCR